MNWLDVIFLLILIFTSVHGLFKGLIKEVASILGLVLGIIAANRYYGFLAHRLGDMSIADPYAWIFAYLIIFTAVLAGVILLGKLLRTLLKIGMLGWVDKLAGGIFGFLKGALVICVIMLILTFVLHTDSPLLKKSGIAPFLTDFNQNLSAMIPDEVKQGYMEKSERLQKIWEDRLQPALNKNQRG